MTSKVQSARVADEEAGPIRIVCVGYTYRQNLGGVLHPCGRLYRLEGSGVYREVPGRGQVEIDYAGTPVASLRRVAAKLGKEQGRPVEDLTRPSGRCAVTKERQRSRAKEQLRLLYRCASHSHEPRSAAAIAYVEHRAACETCSPHYLCRRGGVLARQFASLLPADELQELAALATRPTWYQMLGTTPGTTPTSPVNLRGGR